MSERRWLVFVTVCMVKINGSVGLAPRHYQYLQIIVRSSIFMITMIMILTIIIIYV